MDDDTGLFSGLMHRNTSDAEQKALERMFPMTNELSEGYRVTNERDSVGEWADEWFHHIELRGNADGDECEIIFSPAPAIDRGDQPEVTVLWEGALDFEGTIHEARERYPELQEWLS